ncbi:SUMO-activating enzyme subunit 1A [Datura stramonium]|uniref:SUMO-activating enzyme subunit 1A n=1 Tax=Datura stramonium TaxID=4076 RepID=A0ABS8WMF4_DATST|nr:SUMO-activating enzyme subunit 1A [Datura stramonium]
MSKLYYAMRVIERFEELEGRNPGETSVVKCSAIPDSLLRRLIASRSEFPPVCAIVGGILGQEVIKAISGKGDP